MLLKRRTKFSIVAAIPNEHGTVVSHPTVDHNQHTLANGDDEKAEELVTNDGSGESQLSQRDSR